MKFKELEKLNTDELKKRLQDLKLDLMKLRSQVASGTRPENPGKIRSIRKTIARILMLLMQKEKGVK